MGNNLVHINAENYYESNLTNLILAREEVFLNLYYEENKIPTADKNDIKKKTKDNAQKNHEILKKYNKDAQISYINNHKLTGKLKRYIKKTFFFNFNIPEIQEVVNKKIKSKDLFEESKENIKSINTFGLKVFNIVKKYINSVVPEELKFISEEPLFYYYANQLTKPLIKGEIIYSIYDFISLADLPEDEISELFNLKKDKVFKEQIRDIKNIKKKYFDIVKKYYDIEESKGTNFLKWLIITVSIIVLFLAVFLYKIM